MKVDLYDHAYERSYANNIGPGPSAYSKLYDMRQTDRFKQTAFGRQKRKLTQTKEGPGPEAYNESEAKERQILTQQPRLKFTLAARKIDVVKCKYLSRSSSVFDPGFLAQSHQKTRIC